MLMTEKRMNVWEQPINMKVCCGLHQTNMLDEKKNRYTHADEK
jgi:hypothetical protein